MIESLQKTRPWVLLMGVVGMLGTGLMFLGSLALIAMGSLPGIADESMGGLPGGAAIGVAYMAVALLYFLPSLFLLRYAGAIGRIGPQGNAAALEDALKRQMSFWRFIGILTAAMIVLYIVAIVGVAILAVVGISSAA